MSLSNRQGVVVCGVRSDWLGHQLPPAQAGEVRVYRFRMRLSVVPDPWFFELGIGYLPNEVAEARSKLFMIDVSLTNMFFGLALLDADFSVA